MAAIRSPLATFSILACALSLRPGPPPVRRYLVRAQQLPDGDWTAYGRDAGGERFSPLDVINRENVASLEVAWTFRTATRHQTEEWPADGARGDQRFISPARVSQHTRRAVLALDPLTDSAVDVDAKCLATWLRRLRQPRRRGVASAALNAASSSPPSTRASSHSMPRQGRPSRFRRAGIVDLRRGFANLTGRLADYQVTSPPAVIGDTIVVGSAIADGTDKPHPSGEVRGFDAITGKLRWTWDPVPQERRRRCRHVEGRQPPGARAARMRGRDRGGIRRAISCSSPTGSPNPITTLRRAPRRQPVCELVGRSAPTRRARLALPDRSSRSLGLRRRLAADLVRLANDGKTMAAVAVRVEDRHLFILDRRDRQAADPVQERPCRDDVPGEVAANTQPFPDAPHRLRHSRSRRARWVPRRGSRLVSRDIAGCVPRDSSPLRR